MSVSGTWNVVTKSPMGDQTMVVDLTEDGATLTGTAVMDGENLVIEEGSVSGSEVSWKVSVTKPMKMGLVFSLSLSGDDALSGTAKAGMFPPMKAEGTRG